MRGTNVEYNKLAGKILAALSQLDQKGTNNDVTRAMAIVYEAFRHHAANRSISARKLYRAAHALNSRAVLELVYINAG